MICARHSNDFEQFRSLRFRHLDLPRLGRIAGGLALLAGQAVRDEIADIGQILELAVGLAILVDDLVLLLAFLALLLCAVVILLGVGGFAGAGGLIFCRFALGSPLAQR